MLADGGWAAAAAVPLRRLAGRAVADLPRGVMLLAAWSRRRRGRAAAGRRAAAAWSPPPPVGCRRRWRRRRWSWRRRRCWLLVVAAGRGAAGASWSCRCRSLVSDLAMRDRQTGPRRRRSPPRRLPAARRWLWPTLTMMSPNCSGSVSRPSVSIGNWNDWPAPIGRLADLAGGRLDVLAADRVGHVDGGHVARRQLLRVEPDADAVVALAHDADVGDAVHAQQLVLDVDEGEVAQVDVVVAAVGREEVDDHQDVGRLLADGDALVLDRRRQQRHGQGHAVLHHDQGRVQIDADVEGDRQRVGAVVAHLRRHVEHARHAVDLLLDRRRHGVGHHLGAGPGIADRHRHAGRRDPRILRDRQVTQRDAAGQRDDDGQHRGEDRPIDEELRDHGRDLYGFVFPAGCLALSVVAAARAFSAGLPATASSR